MPKDYYVSIVVPCYKEEKRLSKIFEAIKEYKKAHDFTIETIIVIDGSPDKTAEVAKEQAKGMTDVKIIDRKENRGKGYTVKEGVENATGQYILFTDADNSTPLEQLDKLLKYIEIYPVAIGSRYCDGGKLAHPQPLQRIIGGRVLNAIIQLLAVRGIKDTQCGFKLFEKKAGKEIFKRATFERFSFDIEILAIARKLGYKVKEVGITWYDDPHSTVDPIKDGLRMIKDSWMVRKNITQKKYK
jgi:dolichyl-phosphate beta-glucosyltransferase